MPVDENAAELAVRRQDINPAALSTEQLNFISNTEFVPQEYRGKLPAILACVAYGRALGIPDMAALNSIHMINGRPTYSAHLMSQLARERHHSIRAKVKTDKECTLVGKRADNGDEATVTWTIEKAQRAGLAGKDNWKKYPEEMLFARAVSQLCRELFSDCFGSGAPYTPDELEAVGELVDDQPAEPIDFEIEEKVGEVLGIARSLGSMRTVEREIEAHRGKPDFRHWLNLYLESARLARQTHEEAKAASASGNEAA